VRRGTQEFDRAVVRDKYSLHELSHPAIERLADDVYYVNLDRAEMSDIRKVVGELASAPGVVFDLRGYPHSNHDVLSYLLTAPVELSGGMAIAHVIRPAHTGRAGPTWETDPALLPVLEPHIRGRVAFLTGPGAISYAESVMALVERYRLGEIVGSATAGSNGNVAVVTLPSGCRTRFTGLRVNKPDGSQFHLVGIKPTIPASRTIAGVAAGRDEVLERALAYVRSGTK
jgi:C-terminal processing protease CtpA/Prc